MAAVSFYAELLPNIRSISLSIVPPTPPNATTRAVVPPGASHLNLYHDDKVSTIKLPALSNPGQQEIVVTPRLGEDSFSCRLPVASSPDSSAENRTPWSAPSLSKEPLVSVLCAACNKVILPPNTIKTWKDLPSDNWADMMDFWHCHKPHEKNEANESTEETGKYSSFGKGYSLSQGTGLVDGGYFLFNKNDCENGVQVDASTGATNKTTLSCRHCSAPLGIPEIVKQEQDNSIWRIHKWNIAVSFGGDSARYPLECFLAAQFLAYVENEGTRRLLITNKDDPNASKLKLWIFNPDILYTHTHTDGPVRGMKLYWQTLEAGERPPPTDRLTSSGYEGVELDNAVFNTLCLCLEDSWSAMPEDVQVIGEWKAGVLGRF